MLLGFDELIKLLQDGGTAVAAIGTLVWIVWHYHTKTLPKHQEQLQKVMEAHAEERAALADQCAKERAEMWEAFRRDLENERNIRLRELAELTKRADRAAGPGDR